ncbi:MAG: sensor histidine kinase [Thalassovita sp.]
MRRLQLFLSMLATSFVALAVFYLSYGYFESEEYDKAQGRLSLYRGTVLAELERYSHLTYVLARDPFVLDTAQGADTGTLNTRLEGFADQAGLDAIYLMTPDGLTIAASNHRLGSSFVGQNYSFRPYFQEALAGHQARFYAIGATTGSPGYFIADPVRDTQGQILGVIAMKINIVELENSWRQSGELVLLANADSVVLLSSEQGWRYHLLRSLSAPQRAAIQKSRQFSGQPLEPLDWTPISEHRARISGSEFMHLTSDQLPHGWELHYFAADDRVVARSWLVTASMVLVAGFALILFQVQRARRMGVALKRSEFEEAQLRSANERLAIEIAERRTTEHQLKRTQEDLERASRLAALGQLAASVTHELGQPIAAMKNHLAAAEITGKSTGSFTRHVSALVDRMEGITRQLKFFARSETQDFQDFDLSDAVRTSVTLVEPNVAATGAQIDIDLPQAPSLIRGSRLRIEQVVTNLLRNAIDAAEDTDLPKIHIQIQSTPSETLLEITDNGHGLGQATLAELQEPFVTTRESGRGMGLGLAISTSIINDHGGRMTAQNTPDGGAVFRVSFPMPDTEQGPTA